MKTIKTYKMPNYNFTYDTETCTSQFQAGGHTLLKNARASVRVEDTLYSSADYIVSDWKEETLQDAFGSGTKLCITLQKSKEEQAAPVLRQNFFLYEERNYFLTELEVFYEDGRTIGTNYIVPLECDEGKHTAMQHCSENCDNGFKYFLRVPCDNDTWVKFELNEVDGADTGFEVAAFMDEQISSALIMGSLSHDTWKTGIDYQGENGKVTSLRLYGGANHKWTRDLSPHGTVTGAAVRSPLMMVGYFADWREGLDAYGDANALVTAPKMDGGSVPFGWNSWGSVQDDIHLDIAKRISDYICENLQPAWKTGEQDAVYTVLDSYWDNMTDEELAAFADHCKANGQKPGIYWAPFVSWHSQDRIETLPVEGSDGVLYQEIILKKADGTYYGKELDGASPVDITHPAAQKRVDYFMDRFKKAGFEYIKLDFLVHGALEGKRYDPAVETGTQAYNFGMKYVLDRLDGQMYVNLSIAPTFPYQYCNGKRIACDAYYSIGETEYTLNGLTYGFWEKKLYQYPDPDHLVVWGKDGKATANEAKTRVTSGILLGTSFIAGDNFVEPAPGAEDSGQSCTEATAPSCAQDAAPQHTADRRFREVFTNPDIIRAAKAGTVFYPLEVSCGMTAAKLFYRREEDAVCLAAFNYEKEDCVYLLNLPKLLGTEAAVSVKELWSGSEEILQDGMLSVYLEAAEAKVYLIRNL